jgi:hypothetical protein
MSLSTSTEQLSSESDLILLDKNLPSPKLIIARTVSIVLSQQTDKAEENSGKKVNFLKIMELFPKKLHLYIMMHMMKSLKFQ